mmetsp:Transcript_115598/g.172753  ORF Transcript_115598/g.172753 Transcript_115598/m.172753 type:complete len:193 (+) Transcript_115598:69-647(+)
MCRGIAVCVQRRMVPRSDLCTRTRFDSQVPVPIPLEDYLGRFPAYTHFSPTTYLSSYVLMEKLVSQMEVALTEFNAHRIMAISLNLAMKMQEDVCIPTASFAKLAGISTTEARKLEAQALRALELNCSIAPSAVHEFCGVLANLFPAGPVVSYLEQVEEIIHPTRSGSKLLHGDSPTETPSTTSGGLWTGRF